MGTRKLVELTWFSGPPEENHSERRTNCKNNPCGMTHWLKRPTSSTPASSSSSPFFLRSSCSCSCSVPSTCAQLSSLGSCQRVPVASSNASSSEFASALNPAAIALSPPVPCTRLQQQQQQQQHQQHRRRFRTTTRGYRGNLALSLWLCLHLPAIVTEALEFSDSEHPYELASDWDGQDFLNNLEFFTDDGSTGDGDFSKYISETSPLKEDLVSVGGGVLRLSAETTSTVYGGGRPSVRLRSKDTFNNGLFILKVDHLPTGCGVWPYILMQSEAGRGEYDIIEATNDDDWTVSSLRTEATCEQGSVQGGVDFSSDWQKKTSGSLSSSCRTSASGARYNSGCSQLGPSDSAGTSFNDAGGGVFAFQVDQDNKFIKQWFWNYASLPPDLRNLRPNPSSWGTPFSYFSLNPKVCMPDNFYDMRLVLGVGFCSSLGDLAFGSCVGNSMSCEDFVSQRPEELMNAYWSISRFQHFRRVNMGAGTGFFGGDWRLFWVPWILILLGMAGVFAWRWYEKATQHQHQQFLFQDAAACFSNSPTGESRMVVYSGENAELAVPGSVPVLPSPRTDRYEEEIDCVGCDVPFDCGMSRPNSAWSRAPSRPSRARMQYSPGHMVDNNTAAWAHL